MNASCRKIAGTFSFENTLSSACINAASTALKSFDRNAMLPLTSRFSFWLTVEPDSISSTTLTMPTSFERVTYFCTYGNSG